MFYKTDDNINLISNKAMRLPRNRRTIITGGVIFFLLLIVLFKTNILRPSCLFPEDQGSMIREEKFVRGSDQKSYIYHRNMPLVFIGGVPRSGTTLMRAMLGKSVQKTQFANDLVSNNLNILH